MSIELRRRNLPWDFHFLLKDKGTLLERAASIDLLQCITETFVFLDECNVTSLDSQKDV